MYFSLYIQEVSWQFMHFINSLYLNNYIEHLIGIML